MSFELLVKLGLAVFVLGAVAVVVLYVRNRGRLSPESVPSVARYFGIGVVVAILGYVAGTAIGIFGACFSENTGNLCGLYGVFGVGPLVSGISLFLYGLQVSWRARRSA